MIQHIIWIVYITTYAVQGKQPFTCTRDDIRSVINCEAIASDFSPAYLWSNSQFSLTTDLECIYYDSLKKCKEGLNQDCQQAAMFSHQNINLKILEFNCMQEKRELARQNRNCLNEMQKDEDFQKCQSEYQNEMLGLYYKGDGYREQQDNYCQAVNIGWKFQICVEEANLDKKCAAVAQIKRLLIKHFSSSYNLYDCENLPKEKLIQKNPNPYLMVWVCQDYYATMQCPPGRVIDVIYTYYGRDDSIICVNQDIGRSNETCQVNKEVMQFDVTRFCNGKRACPVPASNHLFGDHCPAVSKYLAVAYSCEMGDKKKSSEVTESNDLETMTQSNDKSYSKTTIQNPITENISSNDDSSSTTIEDDKHTTETTELFQTTERSKIEKSSSTIDSESTENISTMEERHTEVPEGSTSDSSGSALASNVETTTQFDEDCNYEIDQGKIKEKK